MLNTYNSIWKRKTFNRFEFSTNTVIVLTYKQWLSPPAKGEEAVIITGILQKRQNEWSLCFAENEYPLSGNQSYRGSTHSQPLIGLERLWERFLKVSETINVFKQQQFSHMNPKMFWDWDNWLECLRNSMKLLLTLSASKENNFLWT